MKKALIVVDPQIDFFPGGALGVPNGDEIIPYVNKIIAHALKLGWLIIFSRDWHPKKTDHFKKWPVHCVQNTTGAQFHPDIHIPESSIIITKGTSKKDDGYSPFEGRRGRKGKSLDEVLKKRRITTLYVAGLATDYCVRACVLDAQNLDYDTIVLEDAIKAVNIHPTDGYGAMLEMRASFAHVTKTDQVIYEKV